MSFTVTHSIFDLCSRSIYGCMGAIAELAKLLAALQGASKMGDYLEYFAYLAWHNDVAMETLKLLLISVFGGAALSATIIMDVTDKIQEKKDAADTYGPPEDWSPEKIAGYKENMPYLEELVEEAGKKKKEDDDDEDDDDK